MGVSLLRGTSWVARRTVNQPSDSRPPFLLPGWQRQAQVAAPGLVLVEGDVMPLAYRPLVLMQEPAMADHHGEGTMKYLIIFKY